MRSMRAAPVSPRAERAARGAAAARAARAGAAAPGAGAAPRAAQAGGGGRGGFAEGGADIARDVVLADDAGADAVVDVVIDVRNDVRDAHDVPFQRERACLGAFAQQLPFFAFRVFEDSVAHFHGEIEAASFVLQRFHHAHGLAAVIAAPRPEQ